MPDLAMPVFNREPVTSLFGIMHFPNDFEKAGIWAAWNLDGMLQSAPNEQVEEIGSNRIWAVHAMARGYPKIAKEAARALYRGTQTGYHMSYLWHAAQTGVHATLEDAIRGAEVTAGKKFSGTRSSFLAAKAEFSKVLHFWAALSIAHDNRPPRDLRLFITQAEAFLTKMRRLETIGNSFKSPKFHVSTSDFDWPVPGGLRFGTLPEDLLPRSKKRAGRPSRITVQK
jgi:hypothetical protein